MSRIAHAISEVTNVTPDTHQPYVGMSAFAHKAGLHASAIKVDPMLYQHMDPAVVGNDMRMLVSDMAGRASIELKGRELGYDLSGDREVTRRRGGAGEGARVPRLHVRGRRRVVRAAAAGRALPQRLRHFDVESWRVIVERRPDGAMVSEATVKLRRQGGADRGHRRGQRAGQRARHGAAAGARAALPGTRRPGAHRLQGPNPGGLARHRRGDPGAGRIRRRFRARGTPSAWTRT